MNLSSQTIDFFQFICVGGILAVVFDIFRAYRRYNKSVRKFVVVQDVIYFLFALCILISSIVFFLDNSLRFYLFIAMFSGIVIYISFLSKYVIKIYIKIFQIYHNFIMFFILPIKLIIEVFKLNYNFLSKIVKKTCKKTKNMICYIYKRFFFIFKEILNKQKRVVNGKIKKKKVKKKN